MNNTTSFASLIKKRKSVVLGDVLGLLKKVNLLFYLLYNQKRTEILNASSNNFKANHKIGKYIRKRLTGEGGNF